MTAFYPPSGRHRLWWVILLATAAGVGLFVWEGQSRWLVTGPTLILLLFAFRYPRLLYLLLLAAIPLSTEVMITETLGTDLPDEPLMWLMTLSVLLYGLYYRKRIPGIKIDRTLLYLLAAHLAWIGITTCLSADPILSVKYLLAKCWYLASFTVTAWLFVRSFRDLRTVALLLILPATAAALVITVQHGWTGFRFEAVNSAVRPFFRNHVNYGSMLACLAPLIWLLYMQLPAYRRWLLALALFWMTAIILSYSRGAWIALALGGMGALALHKRLLRQGMIWAMLLILLATGWLIRGNRYLEYRPDFATTIYHADFSEHLQATYRLRDLSTAERFYRWIAGLRMVRDAPWFGHGPNLFYPSYRPYTVSAFRTYVSDNHEKSTVHNYLLLLAVEQGVPGLLLFLLLVWAMAGKLTRNYQLAHSVAARQTWLAVAAMLVGILTVNMLSDLVETDKIGSLFFTCLGILLAAPGSRLDRLSGAQESTGVPIR
jgi:O-antigen ligase